MSYHQIAFLNAERLVPWKCLSLDAPRRSAGGDFVPIAYASTSPAFMSEPLRELSETGRFPVDRPCLWIVSRPRYSVHGVPAKSFPYALTAKIVVREILRGAAIRTWADPRDRRLVPPRDTADGRREDWRQASSIVDRDCRAIFRVSRVFAMRAFASSRQESRRSNRSKRPLTEAEAWEKVRTAVADRAGSRFLPHIDATRCVKRAAKNLLSPRTVRAKGVVADLEALVAAAGRGTVFLNYRWNEDPRFAVDVAQELLRSGKGVWLDGLTIPRFVSKAKRTESRREASVHGGHDDLRLLLRHAITRAHLFLSFAGQKFAERPSDGRRHNWAMEELQYARRRPNSAAGPLVQAVALCADIDSIPKLVRDASHEAPWSSDASDVAAGVARLLR